MNTSGRRLKPRFGSSGSKKGEKPLFRIQKPSSHMKRLGELEARVTVGSPAALLAFTSPPRHDILLSNYCLFLVGTSSAGRDLSFHSC